MNLKERARGLKRDIPALFLALRCRETPWTAKLFAALAVGYALSPIDLVPDFIPVLGYLDDVLILPALAAASIHRIPPQVMEKCRAQSEEMWKDGRPKRWYYALPIVAVWVVLLVVVVRMFLN